MKIGTKSVLFGAHQFLIHPWFVAWAWWRLYGFPWDPRLWVAFFVHDLGYIGKPNMDGAEGEEHPYLGAAIMERLFGVEWFDFTLLHSRYLAKKLGWQPSRLCIADKLAIVLTPAWIYLPLVRLSGEIHEYMARAKMRAESGESRHLTQGERSLMASSQARAWYAGLQAYMLRWVEEFKDGRADTWTPARREAIDDNGVTR
jgi:hypothetical protein